MNFNHFRTFVLIGTYLNLSRVATILNTTQATVTRQIQNIENSLGVKLITTTPRGARLTEEGDRFLFFARSIITQIDDLQQEMTEQRESLSGELRVITTRFGAYFLTNHIQEFKAQFPRIDLYIDSDAALYLSRGSEISGTYVGLTTTPPPPNTPLIWQKIATYNYFPFASQTYIHQMGALNSIEDIDKHRIIGYKWSPDFSHIDHKGSNPLLYYKRLEDSPRTPYVTVNDIEICKVMIEQGVGIGMIPYFLACSPSIARVLEKDFRPEPCVSRTLYYVLKENLKSNSRVRALINFCKSKIESNDHSFRKKALFSSFV